RCRSGCLRLELRGQQRGDLDRVQRCALAQVVVGDEEDEPLACRCRLVGADAADEAGVGPGGLERGRDLVEDDAGSLTEHLCCALGGDLGVEFGVDAQAVPGEHGHPHAGAGDREVGQIEDLPALVAQLLLFIGLVLTVVDDAAGHRQDVERDRFDVVLRGRQRHGGTVAGELAGIGDSGLELTGELLDAGQSGTGHRLIGRDDESAQSRLGVEGMVVQVGFARMPLATASRAPGLTSLTTSGTSGSERQAEELSTTVTPAAANRSAWAREVAPPAENRAMSSPLVSASAASSTVMGCPLKSMVFPAERAEANSLRVPISNPGSSARRSSMTPPTWPVAPTTPILTLIVRYLRTPLLRCLHCRVRR